MKRKIEVNSPEWKAAVEAMAVDKQTTEVQIVALENKIEDAQNTLFGLVDDLRQKVGGVESDWDAQAVLKKAHEIAEVARIAAGKQGTVTGLWRKREDKAAHEAYTAALNADL